MPKVRNIRAVSDTIVRVKFDAPILGKQSCLDPDNYVFSEGLVALGAVVSGYDSVDILTTPQEKDRFYTLEMKSNA